MAEPNHQIEVQLGHLCNNRCVFCVSGQLSEQDRAPQLPESPIRRQIEAARANGAKKITFLGGEPTIQRSFISLLERAVALDFDEIVIFTNGVMTPRESFRQRVKRIVSGLGEDARDRVIWRFSLQGGTREAHDETTVNPGSWDRIVESMATLHGENARLSGNMCVVSGNAESVSALADVAQQYGLENLHLDMFRPRDSGDRTEEYLKDLMRTPYSEMATSFRALVTGVDEKLGEAFDLNIGNMPYCVAPDIAWRIHHDGEDTVTVAASGSGSTQEGFNKYLDKRTDKHKLPGCADCVFDDQCGGVFNLYAEIHGHDELVPVTNDKLWETDVRGHHFVLLAESAVRAWAEGNAAYKLGRVDERAAEIDVSVEVAAGQHWRLILRRAGRGGARNGWHVIAGERLECVAVGAVPGHLASATATLFTAISELASRLGDTAIQLDGTKPDPVATAELSSNWKIESHRLADEKKRLTIVKRRTLELINKLRSARIAGLNQVAVRKSDDGTNVDVEFASKAKKMILTLGLRPPAPSTRPTLQHSSEGLSPAEMQRFSAELGVVLRGAKQARSATERRVLQ